MLSASCGRKRIARRLAAGDDGGIAEAEMHDRRHLDVLERAVDHLHGVALGLLGVVAQPRLVELDDVGASLDQLVRLLVHRRGVVHAHRLGVLVELVLDLLAHGERAGQGDLGELVGVGAQELHVAQFNGPGAPDLADHARHRRLLAAVVHDLGRMLVVDAAERGGEAVGVAFPPHLAVGHDVDAGALHVADGDQGRIVLGLLEERLGHAPDLTHARARHDLAQHLAIDQPVGLRIGADDGGLEEHVTTFSPTAA